VWGLRCRDCDRSEALIELRGSAPQLLDMLAVDAMISRMSRTVTAPDGTAWRVGRLWTRRPAPRWRRIRLDGAASDSGWWLPPAPDGPEELTLWLALAVGAVVFVVVLIPLLLFGVELILLGAVIAIGILARALLRRPWLVRAEPAAGSSAVLSWDVHGWWRSHRAIEEVSAAIAEGRSPAPVDGVERLAA
jgi:hypothetical protein